METIAQIRDLSIEWFVLFILSKGLEHFLNIWVGVEYHWINFIVSLIISCILLIEYDSSIRRRTL